MNLEKYLEYLRWEGDIGIRIIRVKDLTDKKEKPSFNAVLIPKEMDGDDGVIYWVMSDVDDVGDRLNLWPSQFAVLGAWPISDLVKGAMNMADAVTDYFESEV